MVSIAMIKFDPNIDRKDNIRGPAESSSPQVLHSSESEDSKIAVRLPRMDRRKPLEKDAKDLMPDSDSDQQQQSFLNSTSSSSSSSGHAPTKVTLPPSQQIHDVKNSIEASSSGRPRGRRGSQGIRAARQRFLRGTAAKQQEAKARNQTSEMSSKSSAPLVNRSGAANPSSSMSTSSTSQSSAQQKPAPQPVVLLPSQSLYAQNPTSFTTSKGFYNQASLHGRPSRASQHPLPQNPNDSSYPSSAMTGRNHRAQNNWANGEYLFVTAYDLPDTTTTRNLWAAFKHEGYISHIRLHENARGYRNGKASIKFRYASKYCPGTSQCYN